MQIVMYDACMKDDEQLRETEPAGAFLCLERKTDVDLMIVLLELSSLSPVIFRGVFGFRSWWGTGRL